ncbi:Shiga-like toxin beta subunit [Erwinia typographi]|uniref:Shiga-like toxin beta subunit n=1 Tax=Erwinia typographi TaxID=371042 RepID=UPI0038B7BD5B
MTSTFPALSAGPRLCCTGRITKVTYNNDETLSIIISNGSNNRIDLFTRRWNLRNYLFNAYVLQKEVSIYTNECRNGGGFAVVSFN